METPVALPGIMMMIHESGNLMKSEAGRFLEELKKNSQFTVISIIGPECSGKSYILNTLFGTEFPVRNASSGRGQTTKGIWMAKCVNPCMIIMDVDGCDRIERGEETSFERRTALFSLTVSDVLLLNMSSWRHYGARLDLIKLIFEERVKIEGQEKTTIIILLRDYDYDEDDFTAPEITKKDLKKCMNELWLKVHSGTTDRKMSDYIKVKVKDFPSPKYEKQLFSNKCKELAEFLCKFAASGGQNTGASNFAHSSERIWDLICNNKQLSAADQKLAMSTYVCSEIKDEILNSLNQETGYESLTSSTSMPVKEFNKELLQFLKIIFTRYEEETKAFDENIRKKAMVKMQEETLQRFKSTFEDKIKSLSTETFSSLKSNVHDKMNNLVELEHSFVVDVIKPYMAEFDGNSRPDVHPYFQEELEKHRKKLEEDLTRIAEEEANKIQIERDQKKAKEI